MNPAAPHPRCPLRVRPRKRPKSRRHWPPDPPSGRSLSAGRKNGERERGRDIREEEDGGTEASGATDGRRRASERASELLLSFARSNLKESVVRGHRSVQQASSPPILPSLPSVFLSLTRVEPRCVPQSSNVSPSSAAVPPPPCTLALSQPLDNMLLP